MIKADLKIYEFKFVINFFIKLIYFLNKFVINFCIKLIYFLNKVVINILKYIAEYL